MQSNRYPLEDRANMMFDTLTNPWNSNFNRVEYIKANAKTNEDIEILKQTVILIEALARVERKHVWEQKCELYGGYPGNQEDVATINYINQQIAALDNNSQLDLYNTIISEINSVLQQKKLKTGKECSATLYQPAQPEKAAPVTRQNKQKY